MQNSTLAMRFLDDLIAIWLATIVLLVAIQLAPNNPARIVLGLPFVLFFPGYVLIAALYPRRSDLDGVERVALSLGLSLAVVPLIGLVLNYTPWGIRLTPILVSLALFIAVCSAAAVRHRMRHSAAERFAGDIRPLLQAARPLPWVNLAIAAGVIGVLLFAGFRFGVLGGSRVRETFTEFYVLGPGGKAEGYPRRLMVGEPSSVIVGVINHEGHTAGYKVEVQAGLDRIASEGPFALADGEKREDRVAILVRRPAKQVKVEFVLFMEAAQGPYRTLHIWVDVVAP
jgi:uncharacterized membrane protein